MCFFTEYKSVEIWLRCKYFSDFPNSKIIAVMLKNLAALYQCTFPLCTAETEGFGKLISSLNMKQRGGQIKNIENEFENCVLSICVSLMKKVLALFENKFSSFRNVSSKVPKQDLLTNRLFQSSYGTDQHMPDYQYQEKETRYGLISSQLSKLAGMT